MLTPNAQDLKQSQPVSRETFPKAQEKEQTVKLLDTNCPENGDINSRSRFKIKVQEAFRGELVPVKEMTKTGNYLLASPFDKQDLPIYVLKEDN